MVIERKQSNDGKYRETLSKPRFSRSVSCLAHSILQHKWRIRSLLCYCYCVIIMTDVWCLSSLFQDFSTAQWPFNTTLLILAMFTLSGLSWFMQGCLIFIAGPWLLIKIYNWVIRLKKEDINVFLSSIIQKKYGWTVWVVMWPCNSSYQCQSRDRN